MRKIEGEQAAWTNIGADRVINQRMRYGTQRGERRVSAGYQAAGQVNQSRDSIPDTMDGHAGAVPTPEYQNDITDRRYEIVSWLQEMGTLEDTSMADVTGEGICDAAGKQAAAVRNGSASVRKQTQESEPEEEAGTTEQAEGEKTLEETEAENELARLKKMLDSLNRRKTSAVKVKRSFPYSYQRVSTAIRGAKTVMQASNALSSANTSLNQVRRQAATGKYSDKEISIAKNHARKMVRVARRKLRHLKAEVSQKQDGAQTKNHTRQKMNTAAAAAHGQEKREMQRQKNQELFQLTKEIQRAETRYKNRHRRKENWALMEADMEYLRRRIEYLKNQEARQESAAVPDGMSGITSGGAVSEETKIFTESGQSVILEQEGVVGTTVEGRES